MCGIAGIISKDKMQDISIITAMTDTLAHRGPDDSGYYQYENFIFGHRRLSIVDLSSSGHQPMEYLDRYVITFNGEIYNHIELKKQLEEHDYLFKSNTDTEVIMASYDFWKEKCLSYFNGMWSFVIYDKLKDIFFISRDRFGKKPFYYYKDQENFVFASEIKAILAYLGGRKNPNIEFLKNYLNKGCQEFTHETAFESIYRFPVASYFEGNCNTLFGTFEAQQFWTINPNLSTESFNEAKAKIYAQQYFALLEDAVRVRLRADVKIGSALSGGHDSSSIVYLINKLLKEQNKEDMQETFSSVYKSKGTEACDESHYINLMAQKLHVHSNQIEPNEDEIPTEYNKMIYALENPPENSLMSSWYTFKLVHSTDVKVTLDGQGADEQLAGYLPYLTYYLSSLSLKDTFIESIKCITIPNAKLFVLKGFCVGILRHLIGMNFLTFLIRKILNKKFEFFLNKKLANDTMSNLITLIHYADHTSMAFSVESRMPFMDYRLVEFLASVPACYKMHNGWTKYIARLAFNDKLPHEINWRKDKMGWPIPEQKWFNGSLKNWFQSKIQHCKICNLLQVPKKINTTKQLALSVKKVNIAIWESIFIMDKR